MRKPKWHDPNVVAARLRLRDIATLVMNIAGYGSAEEILTANRRLHMPRTPPTVAKFFADLPQYKE
jgi:hypothetical protein